MNMFYKTVRLHCIMQSAENNTIYQKSVFPYNMIVYTCGLNLNSYFKKSQPLLAV